MANVLLVNPDGLYPERWERILKVEDLDLVQAHDLKVATELLEQGGIDLILAIVPSHSDDVLPAVARWIQDNPDVPIVAALDVSSEATLKRMVSLGVDQCLTVDGTDYTLRASLRSALEKRTLLRENQALSRKLEGQVIDFAQRGIVRQAEEKDFGESVLQSMTSGLIIVDRAGRITSMNRAAQKILGYAVSELSSLPLDRIMANPEERILDWDEIKEEMIKFDQEVELIRKDNTPVVVGYSASPHRNSQGRTIGAIIIFRDLTEIKRIRENIRYMDRLASLGELTAGIAHEIRNPLAGIKTTAQALRAELEPDNPHCEYLDRIIKEINRTNSLLQNFFAYARPQRPNFVLCDVAKVMDRVIALQLQNIDSRGIALQREYTEPLPRVMADPDQIYQLFLNLVLNAIDAMPRGGTLAVRIAHHEDPSFVLNVSIEDSGEGMTQETREKLFDPFFTTKPSGTGLGLSISYNIVKEHGGTISVESRVGKGSTFEVCLPLKP